MFRTENVLKRERVRFGDKQLSALIQQSNFQFQYCFIQHTATADLVFKEKRFLEPFYRDANYV